MEGKIIRTHTKAWNIEKQIHVVGDVKLPFPITLDTLGFALVGAILATLICKIPIIGSISPFWTYILGVVGLPYAMKKLRIHSKTPARFLLEYCEYLLQPKSLARFQPVKKQGPIRFSNVNFRR